MTVVPRCRATVPDPLHPAAVHLDLGALALALGGGEPEPGDRGDRRQRLAAEAEGRAPRQVGRAPDLAGGVAIEREHRILAPHAGAVVAHLDEGLAALLQLDAHPGRARIDRVLDQFLHRRGGALHHLAGGDLVGDGIGQNGNAAGHAQR